MASHAAASADGWPAAYRYKVGDDVIIRVTSTLSVLARDGE